MTNIIGEMGASLANTFELSVDNLETIVSGENLSSICHKYKQTVYNKTLYRVHLYHDWEPILQTCGGDIYWLLRCRSMYKATAIIMDRINTKCHNICENPTLFQFVQLLEMAK